ncbi:hypothetical protein [Nostoc punctiforme]|uniref:hypothetical protein n=1 Tax=Nostoc punctiforme TaxID=272131 RepID=UPI000324B4D2|nr:hypothetical protein [Nostoc punctiforme]
MVKFTRVVAAYFSGYPLTKEHFRAFKEIYGDDANGGSPHVDKGESGRWRYFTREDIAKRGENLDITWL